MEKISRQSALQRVEFAFADELLRSYVERVAETEKGKMRKGMSVDDKKLAHWDLVAKISKLYMVVVSSLSEDLIEKINKTKGNVFKLNKFLALRQLAETQLTGIMQGTWDLGNEIVSKELFQQRVADSPCCVSPEEIVAKIEEDFEFPPGFEPPEVIADTAPSPSDS